MKLSLLRRMRSFQRGTVGLCRSTGIKVASCQSWRFEKYSATQPNFNQTKATLVEFHDNGIIPNFDCLQLCRQLTYRDPQYLFGNILTSLITQFQLGRIAGFLIQVMLCQSDLILLHKRDHDDSQSHTTVA